MPTGSSFSSTTSSVVEKAGVVSVGVDAVPPPLPLQPNIQSDRRSANPLPVWRMQPIHREYDVTIAQAKKRPLPEPGDAVRQPRLR